MRLGNFASVGLPELLHQVAELYGPVVEDSGQTLHVELGGPVEVHADGTLLMQMFSNLLENAIRHAGRGAVIGLQCGRSGDEAWVRLTDSGPGIPPSERDRVFNRLYRLERSRNTPGFGLGLSLVAAIAKLHQYTIELTDAQPGLCVTIHMPLPAMRASAPVSAAGVAGPAGAFDATAPDRGTAA